MKVLFDQGVPVPLRDSIPAEVSTCYEMGWSTLSNGELLAQAETEFDSFVTTDKNLRYQQDLVERNCEDFLLRGSSGNLGRKKGFFLHRKDLIFMHGFC